MVCLFLASGAMAQQKETVHSVIVEWRDVEWYKTQQELWGKDTEKNRKNAEAWINYYSAVRALRNCSYENKDEQMKYSALCDKIAKDAYAAVPNSFEGNFIMSWNTGIGNGNEKYLVKAYELKKDDPRVLLDMLINAEIKRDKKLFSDVAKKIYEINRMPSGALAWAYNVLTEVSENGIVFSAGDNDTYALWIVQEAMNYRKDVMVMNTSMILLDDYRAKLFKEKGLTSFSIPENTDYTLLLFEHICNNEAKIPVHVSVSAIEQFNDSTLNDNLYLTGLTYIYSTKDVENIAVIKRNFEKRFLIDHLTKNFSYSYGDLNSRIKHMYIPGLIKLYQHAKTADDLEGITFYNGLIEAIGKELHMEEDIQKAMNE